MTKTIKTISVYIAIFALMLIGGAILNYFTKITPPNLPFNGLPKQAAVQLLEQSDQQLVKLMETEDVIWYGYKGNQGDGGDALKDHFLGNNWKFVDQMGAGYFFEDEQGNRNTVTSQMWTGKYVLYKVPAGMEAEEAGQ